MGRCFIWWLPLSNDSFFNVIKLTSINMGFPWQRKPRTFAYDVQTQIHYHLSCPNIDIPKDKLY